MVEKSRGKIEEGKEVKNKKRSKKNRLTKKEIQNKQIMWAVILMVSIILIIILVPFIVKNFSEAVKPISLLSSNNSSIGFINIASPSKNIKFSLILFAQSNIQNGF